MNRANFIKFFQISVDFVSFWISIFLASLFYLNLVGRMVNIFP